MAAPTNSKPKPAVVVRHDMDRPSNFWRLFPAAAGSAIFHTGLLFLLLLVSNLTEASPVNEKEKVKKDPTEEKDVVTAKPVPKPPESNDPFVTADVDPSRAEFDTDINNEAERKAEISINEMVRPDQAVGSISGSKDASPISMPPALGIGGIGSGGIGGGLDLAPGIGLQGVGLPGGTGGLPRGVALAGSIYGRSGASREFLLRQGGGTGRSEAAVARGLRWLVINQGADGTWPGCGNDIAGAAFGLLPLLGAGHTHKPAPKNPYDKPILKGLQFLIAKQNKKTGDFGGGMYAQGLATIAMCEAYGLSQDPMIRQPAQLAVNYIVNAQHDAGGWRYGPKQPGDTSVVGWQVMALKSAQMSGLDVPEATMRKAVAFLDNVVGGADEGYGYAGKGSSPTMSSVGLLCRQYLQAWGAKNKHMNDGVKNHLRVNPGVNNMYYTYYATQVMHHFGGKEWDDWNKKTRDHLIDNQNTTNGPDGGSWDPNPGGHVHGRIMMTSLCLLTLEVYYRHLPLYYRDAGEKMAK